MIKPKVKQKGKQYNEHAKRYIFYPLQNLDFAGSQAVSPIWTPKIERGRFTLLESFEYMTQVTGEGEQMVGSNGVILGERIMGTDAQVNFLMGSLEGVGFYDKGMVHLESLLDVDPETAMEVESMLKLDAGVPSTLIEFRKHFGSLSFEGDNPVVSIAKNTLVECSASVEKAIAYCRTYTGDIEQELRQGQNGGVGIKSISETMKYYFRQIEAPLPEDRVGTNAGSELAKALAPLLDKMGVQNPAEDTMKDRVELEELRKRIEIADATIAQQDEVISSLEEANEPEQPTTDK